MRGVRPPSVGGQFYPRSGPELAGTVDRLLAEVDPGSEARPLKVVVVPHAGYVYSGSIAAGAYARVARMSGITRVVLFGPAHRVALRGLALPRVAAFRTPLGDVPVVQTVSSGPAPVAYTDEPHAPEHSLEVQLPFLQKILPALEILPFLVGDATAADVAAAMDQWWGGPETLIVVSSDLSHYHPYVEARRLDARTVESILAYEGPLHPRQACGAYPLNGLLRTAARRGLRGELFGMGNSGDTAGDRDRVVGYASIGFSE